MNISLQANQYQTIKIINDVLVFESYGNKINYGLENLKEWYISEYDIEGASTLRILLKNNQTLHIQVLENVNEFRNLVTYLNEIINKHGEVSINYNSSNKLLYSNEYNDLIYLGGHPSIPPSQEVRVLYIDSENITIRDIENVYNIPISKVISYKIETKKEIEERVTLPRLLAFGIYALAIPKIDINIEKYLVIEVEELTNILTLVFSGPAIKKVFQIIHDYKLNNHSETGKLVIKKSMHIEELKGLKELLDLGIINFEEFEIKKKELLNL